MSEMRREGIAQARTPEEEAERQRLYEEGMARERAEELARYTEFKGFMFAVCAELMEWEQRPWTIEEDDDESNRRWSPNITLRRSDHVGLCALYHPPRLKGVSGGGSVQFSPTVPRTLQSALYRTRYRNEARLSRGFALNRKAAHVAKALHKTLIPEAVSELASAQAQEVAEDKATADVARIAGELVSVAPDALEAFTPGGSRDSQYTRFVSFVRSGSGSSLHMDAQVTCYPGETAGSPYTVKIKLDDVPVEVAQEVLKLVAAAKQAAEKGE